MRRALGWFLLFCACAAVAQQKKPVPDPPAPPFQVVMGLDGAKDGARGGLGVAEGALVFTPPKGVVVKIPLSNIQDISLGNDSKRTLSGVGQVTMLAPYGSGRFLSLFRDKLDILTVAYRDENGGLHGAIFRSKPGLATPVKTAAVSAGAKSSTPVEQEKPAAAKAGATDKAQPQPAGKKENK
jgi:hypothetical protein